MPNERQIYNLWLSFIHDVTKTTFRLMILLEGTEIGDVRKREIYKNWAPDHRMGQSIPTNLSYLDAMPYVYGFDIELLLRRNGYAEQLAYKGWVVEVYGIWEDQYRRKLKKEFNIDDSIPPEMSVLGDLRLIRNDLVHRNGKAKRCAKEKCKILKWFDLDKEMIFNIHRVLDFLNQIGGIKLRPFELENKTPAEISWWIMEEKEKLLSRKPVPKIVSIRPGAGSPNRSDGVDTKYSNYEWCFASIVFDNGFFAQISFCVKHKRSHSEKLSKPLHEVSITPQGDLLWPTGELLQAETLYRHGVESHFMSDEERESKRGGTKIDSVTPIMKFR